MTNVWDRLPKTRAALLKRRFIEIASMEDVEFSTSFYHQGKCFYLVLVANQPDKFIYAIAKTEYKSILYGSDITDKNCLALIRQELSQISPT